MPGDLKSWKNFFLMGLLNNFIPFSLISWGETRIASGLASILNATTPFFTAILAHFLTGDERLTRLRLGGMLLGFTGVTVMIGWGFLGGLGGHPLPELAVIGAAVSYAGAGVFGKRFAGRPPLVTATGQVTATTLLVLPVALAVDRPWTVPWPSLGVWGSMAGLGLLCTALAYIIYFRVLKRAGATNVLLVTFLIPVTALFLGTVFLGERLADSQLLGSAFILLGLAAIDGRLFSWIKSAGVKESSPRLPGKPFSG